MLRETVGIKAKILWLSTYTDLTKPDPPYFIEEISNFMKTR